MKKIAFDEEELLVLAVLEPDTRRNTIRSAMGERYIREMEKYLLPLDGKAGR